MLEPREGRRQKRRSFPWMAGAIAPLLITSLLRADAAPALSELRAGSPRVSIHQLEQGAWNERNVRYTDAPAPRAPLAARASDLTREVHGYHPYWMGNAYLSYDWSLLSTVAFFSLELDASGAITNDHGWPWSTLVSTAHQNGVRVIVTATLFSTSAIEALLSSPASRQNAISNLTAAVVAGSADGVNVDFEGVPGSRKQDLVTFLGDLQAALQAEVVDPYLSIATPAVDWSNAFDYDELAARCDHLMIMAYDYHWFGSAATGPVAPLAGWGTYNVGWTIQDYQTWGALPGQMLLGVPYYGYRWPAASGDPGAATTDDGVALIYDQAQAEAETHGTLWDGASSTPWYRYQTPSWFQGWYDDALSLSAKYELVTGESLAGVGVWALGYDGERPELWTALESAFGGNGTDVEDGPTLPSQVWIANVGPNPFRERARFRYALAAPAPARISVHDVTGRRLRRLFEGPVSEGLSHVIDWDGLDGQGREVSPGTYFVRLESQGRSATSKVIRIR